MSLTDLFQEIRGHTDNEGQMLLDVIYKGLRRYEPQYAADALDFCLNTDLSEDDDKLLVAPGLVDDLEEALEKWFVPDKNQENAFKKDMLRFFEYMRAFLELGRVDGARDIMTFYEGMFNRNGKKICGAVRSRCVLAGKGGCRYKFDAGIYVCPDCDATRTFCRKYPMQNGRCGKSGYSKGHGGNQPKGAMSPTFIDGRRAYTRGVMFADQLKGKPNLERMFIQALQDPDYLSLLPEISLMAARRGQLLAELDDLDPQEIEAAVQSHVGKIRVAVAEDKPSSVYHHAQAIEALLQQGKDNRGRWHEMNSIAGQMARLADTERKRLVEAKKAVPIADMLRLQQETIKAVRTAVISGSEVLHMEIMGAKDKGILDNLTPDHIKRTMLRHLNKQLQSDAEPDIVEGETSPLEEEE